MTADVRALAGAVLHVETRTVPTRHGDFAVHVCRDLMRRTYVLVIARGDVRSAEPLLARVHSSCVTSETFGGCDCDCAEQLDAALAAVASAGRGVVFYLDQEGRGAGFTAKVRDRMLVQASGGTLDTFDAYARMGLPSDLRSYEAVAAARAALGIAAPLRLLTNNPDKPATLGALGVPLAGSVPLALAPSPFNRHYLAAKSAAGHRLAIAPGGDEAPLPGPVELVEPHVLPATPRLVAFGSYWLPVRPFGSARSSPIWFRLHAYLDAARGRERVVLVHGTPAATPVLVRVQREALLERVPAATPGREKGRWLATVRAFAAHGAGVALMRGDERGDSVLGGAADDLASDVALLRHHVGVRVAIPLADGGNDAAWHAALAASGVTTTAARPLAA